MKKRKKLTEVKVGFYKFQLIEPKDLISFSKRYLDHGSILKPYLVANQGKRIKLVLARINPEGSFVRKLVYGTVGDIKDNQFIFSTTQDFHNVYESPIDLVIRFDNVLGTVPLLPKSRLKPFKVGSSAKLRSYFNALKKMRKLLEECVGKVHAAKLRYRYCKEKPTFRDGNYTTECEILKVNKSNVQFKHFRTSAFVNPENKHINLNSGIDIDRFVAPDRYLQEVIVTFGIKHNFNPIDDGD
jgi:hypothetical protein